MAQLFTPVTTDRISLATLAGEPDDDRFYLARGLHPRGLSSTSVNPRKRDQGE